MWRFFYNLHIFFLVTDSYVLFCRDDFVVVRITGNQGFVIELTNLRRRNQYLVAYFQTIDLMDYGRLHITILLHLLLAAVEKVGVGGLFKESLVQIFR